MAKIGINEIETSFCISMSAGYDRVVNEMIAVIAICKLL